MGYFSQRKKQERVNFALNMIIGIIGVLTLLAFFDASGGIFATVNAWRFHYYIILLAAFLYALFSGYFIHAFFALVFLIVNYMVLASSTNVFLSASGSSENSVGTAVVYQKSTRRLDSLLKRSAKAGAEIVGVNSRRQVAYFPEMSEKYRLFHADAGTYGSFIMIASEPQRAGKLRLTPERDASFAAVKGGSRSFTFVNLDFSGLKPGEEKVLFDNLAEFVLSQDDPLIIVGDFGIPAWSDTFKRFLHKTELEVKNRIIPSSGKSLLNIFSVPTVNILAYRNVGVEEIELLKDKKNPYRPFLFKLKL